MEAGKRCCHECGEVLDENTENFRPLDDGSLSIQCVGCDMFQAKQRIKKERAAQALQMRKVEAAAVEHLLQESVRGGANIPHSAELTEQTMHYFGGVNGFAAMLTKQYFDAKPGSTQRGRILEMVVRLVQKNVDQGGAQKPLQLWSEDELEQELTNRMRLALQSQGRLIDGKAEAAKSIAYPAADSDPATPPTEDEIPSFAV